MKFFVFKVAELAIVLQINLIDNDKGYGECEQAENGQSRRYIEG